MQFGPLEYVVVGCSDAAFVRDVLPVLVAIQRADALRVVDIILLTKTPAGAIACRELSDLDLAPITDEDESRGAKQRRASRSLVEHLDDLDGLGGLDDLVDNLTGRSRWRMRKRSRRRSPPEPRRWSSSSNIRGPVA